MRYVFSAHPLYPVSVYITPTTTNSTNSSNVVLTLLPPAPERVNVDLPDIDHVVSTFVHAHGFHFRYLDRKWWVFEDGYWSMFQAKARLMRAIMIHTQDLFPDEHPMQKKAKKLYYQDRVTALISQRLFVDRLPGRQEFPPEPS